MQSENRVFSDIIGGSIINGHKVENMVYITDNYEMFKLSKFNRNVLISKEMLEQAKQGFLAPIIVNENLVVIDGQHRLEASRMENKPIKYIIISGLNKDDIIRMNTVQRKWSLLNYIESYANDGKEEYIKLVNLIKENFSNVTVVSNISVNSPTNSKVADQQIKSGEFKFHNYEKTVEYLQYYTRFREETKTPKRSTVATALYELFKLKDFDKNRMIEKTIATELSEEIKVKTFRHTDILKQLIESYNNGLRKNSERIINFHITSLGTLVIEREKEEWATK